MSEAVVALGANMGDRAANLREAVRRLGKAGMKVLRVSEVWETPPMPADQPWFLNAAVVVETNQPPEVLLSELKAIEHDLGRRPGRRWGPRPIDLDILFYDKVEMDTPALTIPHPRIAERAFVLVPLRDVWPGALPVLNRTPDDLLAELPLEDREAIRPTGEVLSS